MKSIVLSSKHGTEDVTYLDQFHSIQASPNLNLEFTEVPSSPSIPVLNGFCAQLLLSPLDSRVTGEVLLGRDADEN